MWAWAWVCKPCVGSWRQAVCRPGVVRDDPPSAFDLPLALEQFVLRSPLKVVHKQNHLGLRALHR